MKSRLTLRLFMNVMVIGMVWIFGRQAQTHASVQLSEERKILGYVVTQGKLQYGDALISAKALKRAIYEFLANPSSKTHQKAKSTYQQARVAYQQTEAFRFAHPEVDELEGRVNAWPLDEGFIDYVAKSYAAEGGFAKAYLMAQNFLKLGTNTLSLTTFDTATLRALHEFAGSESNVATGYHAIEFLLWGQDLSGAAHGAGNRSFTDYMVSSCTVGHCQRRKDYLLAVTNLLVEDVAEMAELFSTNGAVAQRLLSTNNKKAFHQMIEGLASFTYGELAGERMQLGLLLGDPEEEHDCFSDLTHLSHYYNVVGIHNIYFGTFTDLAGKTSKGAALADYVRRQNPELATKIEVAFTASLARARVIYDAAERSSQPMSYDMMLLPENAASGGKLVQDLVDALKVKTDYLLAVGKQFGFEIRPEGSDSLDNPKKVLEEGSSL